MREQLPVFDLRGAALPDVQQFVPQQLLPPEIMMATQTPVADLPVAFGLPVIQPSPIPFTAGGVTAEVIPGPTPFVHVEAPLGGEAVLGPAPGLPLGAIVQFSPPPPPAGPAFAEAFISAHGGVIDPQSGLLAVAQSLLGPTFNVGAITTLPSGQMVMVVPG